jgi:hypothetical protein
LKGKNKHDGIIKWKKNSSPNFYAI